MSSRATDPVTALIDAADELLSAQQALLGPRLPPAITRLAEAYLAARLAAMDGRAARESQGDR